MQITGEISQWGNGLALRLNQTITQSYQLKKGTKVNIDMDEKGIHISPFKKRQSGIKLPLSEKELLGDITPYSAHADEIAAISASEIGE